MGWCWFGISILQTIYHCESLETLKNLEYTPWAAGNNIIQSNIQ